MTGPAYYRPRVPSWVIAAAVAVIGAALGVWFVVSTVARLQLAERTRTEERIYREANAWATAVVNVQTQRLNRELDSLRALTASQDNALQHSTEQARVALHRLAYAIAHPDSTPTETVTVRVSTAINACTAAVNDCEQFRATALTRFAKSDSMHEADSTAIRQASLHLVAKSDTLDRIRASTAHLVSRSTLWKNRAEYGVVGAATGALLCLIFCQ